MNILNASAKNQFGEFRGADLYRAGCSKSRVALALNYVRADTTGTFTAKLQRHLKNGTANAWLAAAQMANRASL